MIYLGLRRMFELLVLLARSHDHRELEILVLRHELSVLRQQTGRARYEPRDRALLAALSRALRRDRWSAFTVTPETLMRWHRRMVSRRWTYDGRGPGRPRLDPYLAELILRLARENPRWGHRRIVGELKKLGFSVSETSVRNLLRAEAIVPAPRRSGPTWRAFIRQQAASMIACDFFTVETISLRRFYVQFFIELESRYVRLAGCTTNPTGAWVTQQARNLSLSGVFERMRFLIHDRDSKFTSAFDEVFAANGSK